MPPEPIEINLNSFERLAILRQEMQNLEKELEKAEGGLRICLESQARREYLSSLSAYFSKRGDAEAGDPDELARRREEIYQALEAVRAQIPVLESEIARGGARPSARAAGLKAGRAAPAAPRSGPSSAGSSRTRGKQDKKRLQSFGDF